MCKTSPLLLAALLALTVSAPAYAQDHRWHGDFHGHDFDHWRGGSWYHGIHGGRDGWWWRVDGAWYFYAAPIYPYPDPYIPPGVVVETAPAPVVVGAPPTYVYYCANPQGYYPDVSSCYGAWEKIMSSPGTAPAPAPVSLRESDERQLSAYAAQFQNADLNDPHARSNLRRLEKQIESFRQALYTRDYDAMKLVRDSDALEHRIAAQREKLPTHGVIVASPPPQ